jgi:hypothetical protein
MSNEVYIYHFTKKESLHSILRDGLLRSSKFNSLGSRLRSNASYFWLSPDNDGMGYKGNSEYECLQINADIDSCMVANMDLISAAFVNFIMEKNDEALYDYRKLVALYDTTAVSYRDYVIGSFRAPEVIIQNDISPKKITVAQNYTDEDSFAKNRDVYNANLKGKLSSLKTMQKVAVHDDSTGLLYTYRIDD